MKQSRRKILHYVSVWGNGGVEKIITNIIQKTSDKYQHDLFVARNYMNDNIYETLLKKHHVNIYINKEKSISKGLKNVASQQSYDLVHIHTAHRVENAKAIITKFAFPRAKVIVYCHTVSLSDGTFKLKVREWLDRLGVGYLSRFFVDKSLAVSKLVLEDAFFKQDIQVSKASIFYAGIDMQGYQFDEHIRESTRKSLGVENDELLLGHIGRVAMSKNPLQLLDIIIPYLEQHPKAKFLYIGKGDMQEIVDKRILESTVKNRILRIEQVKNSKNYLMAMDVFVLPSLSEGLPLVALEAQTTGLSCVLSTAISKDTQATDLVSFVELTAPINAWHVHFKKTENNRADYYETMCTSEFNDTVAMDKLNRLYSDLLKTKS
ncbi:glycosyltransferase [Streptococcus respiraculi]|uniref:glycosyltransferase n=1 Tax=Streptococcus respiraculi TaxID=2021971 RepID=UPI000E720A66|nr:glycosyltransferase [Streptococcus respiraculi]